MAIPQFSAMYPSLLKALSDGQSHPKKEIFSFIAQDMGISQEEIQQDRQANGQLRFYNRTNWACTYLKKAGLIESVQPGHFRITEEGARVRSDPPPVLDNAFLRRYDSFNEFLSRPAHAPKPTAAEGASSEAASETDDTPNDRIEQAIAALNQKLAEELMSEIMAKDPYFFEELVVKLLRKMGYGGSSSDAGIVTQKTNDGGIDGIIREDKLGFDQIYIQAKRWDPSSTVSRPDIQKFSGALQDEGASKGLFITTARFSEGARQSAEKQHIVLIDGQRLTRLMIEYNVGAAPIARYEIKAIDLDFFSDDAE